MNTDEVVNAVVSALEDIKGEDIVVLDVHDKSSLFERMVLASANSPRQTKALANNVEVKLKELGQEIIGVEGRGSGEWVLVDLGSVIVHVMQPHTRSHYRLEELWGK